MKWRPHTETPATDEPMSALLAAGDDEANGEFFLLGIKLWRKGQWVGEDHFNPVRCPEFWWVPEEEITAELKRAVRNGARQRRRRG